MAVGPLEPRELLKEVESFLGKEGDIRSPEGVSKIFSLMKASQKMVGRCLYLNILLQTKSQDILNRFIRVGGYKLLNGWLTYSKTTNNTPMLQLILLTLQKLPLTVDHLKQNNTAKLVKQLSKSGYSEELRKLASVLVDGWMAIIRSQSGASSAGASPSDKKRKREEVKGKTSEVKGAEGGKPAEEEKKREKPKAPRTTAPSHAKFRSTGLEVEAPAPVPPKKNSAPPQLGDKYNIKPAVLKRQSSSNLPDIPPVEKKYKPLNTTPNSTKEIKVKIIPPQPIECTGFLDALNSAPVPGIKIKKKKKAVSPTSNKSCPFDSKPSSDAPAPAKPSSPEPASAPQLAAAHDAPELEQPGTPVPTEEGAEPMDTAEKPNALSEPRGEDEPQLTRKGRKRKTVRWAEDSQLKQYFYFELDETERVNVNKIKDFGEAAKREMMMDRQAFETARRLSHDAMEEKVPWAAPRPLNLPSSLVIPGSASVERYVQQDREKGILQEIFLSKESVPDSPHEPDPEPYEPVPPRLIPLDEDSSSADEGYLEPMDTAPPSSHSPEGPGAKLPPVLANLMGSLGSGRSPQTQGSGGNSSSSTPAVNMQELLSTIMGGSGTQTPEDLIKQPDFSDKIKQLLGSLQQSQPQPPPPGPPPASSGLLGHGPPHERGVPPTQGRPPLPPPRPRPPRRALPGTPRGGGRGPPDDGAPASAPPAPRGGGLLGPAWGAHAGGGGPHGMRGGGGGGRRRRRRRRRRRGALPQGPRRPRGG